MEQDFAVVQIFSDSNLACSNFSDSDSTCLKFFDSSSDTRTFTKPIPTLEHLKKRLRLPNPTPAILKKRHKV